MRAYVSLGSNLGDREANLRQALERLGNRFQVIGVSTFRETEPWGAADQPPYLNAAVAIETELPPRALLDALLAVEGELGRVRDGTRWAPRTIDLDLLLYGDLELDEPGLTVPHPHLHERRFALEPLLDLDPGLVVPGRGPVAGLLQRLDSAA
jgi:2-amino-4-hydroxy-6-hydroxymethyldihydropteridine diphosphokinase